MQWPFACAFFPWPHSQTGSATKAVQAHSRHGPSGLLVAPLRGPAPAATGEEPALAAAVEGIRVVAREPGPRALVLLLGVESVAIGALDVLYVVLAVAVLGRNGASAGYLNAAFGAGGVAGVAVTVALVGRQRLVPWLLGGVVVCAAALGGVAATPSFAIAAVPSVAISEGIFSRVTRSPLKKPDTVPTASPEMTASGTG